MMKIFFHPNIFFNRERGKQQSTNKSSKKKDQAREKEFQLEQPKKKKVNKTKLKDLKHFYHYHPE